MEEKKRKLEHDLLEDAKIRYVQILLPWQSYCFTVTRQKEIVAEEEKNQYAELAHLAMLLGFPGAMIDEGMASLKRKPPASEVRHTNVLCFVLNFLP